MGAFDTAETVASTPGASEDTDSAAPTPGPSDPNAVDADNDEEDTTATANLAVDNPTVGRGEREDWDRVDLENQRRFRDSDDQSNKMLMLLKEFTPEQLRRYENYRRAGLQRSHVKKIMMSATGGSSVPSNSVIVMAGIAKVFCGEVVEMAVQVQQEWKHEGQLHPQHIREAVRRLKRDESSPRKFMKRW